MNKYIGPKVIKARAMNRGDYNEYRGWDIPADENPADEGYLVGSPDKDGEFYGSLESGCDHITWLPKDQFDAIYKPMTGMSFGLAIETMKAGYKVARAEWNGKGMYIFLDEFMQIDKTPINKFITMFTAQKTHQPGWLASQTDMLADDWQVAG